MHFVMYAFSNHVGVLHNVTPVDLPAQSAGTLGDNRRFYLTGWLWRVCISIVPDHSPPVEGWQAQPDGVVVACLHQHSTEPFPSCGGVAGVA